MPADAPPDEADDATAGSVHLRVTCALLASAARLVPIPFLDDILRERILQLMVSRTLKAHGRHFSSGDIKVLWSEESGCVSGCLLFFFKLPLKLLLLPIRKIIAVVGLLRGLSQDLTEMLLLGRTLDRCLSAGMLGGIEHGKGPLLAEARIIRTAFDNAVRGMDLDVLRGLLADALGKVTGLAKSAVHALRALFRRRRDPNEVDLDAEMPAEDRAVVQQGAGRVEEVLARPEVVALLELFDRTFDENHAHLRGQVANAT